MSRLQVLRLFGLVAAAIIALAPALAEARAGGGASAGSRGARTQQSAPPTRTAPEARPVERSSTAPAVLPGTQRPAASIQRPAQQQSWFQRNPFMSGLIGGLVGAGLIGMLFGSGLFGADLGFAAMLGLLLQLALIGSVVWFAMAMLRRRTPAQPAYALAEAGAMARDNGDVVRVHDTRPPDLGGRSRPSQDAVGLTEADFGAFERLLATIQGAWGRGDEAALRTHLTPEMQAHFRAALADDADRGVANVVEDVKLEQGDLAEAWAEGATQYATVAMRWSALDYTVRRDGGQVVAGSRDTRREATEVWTFRRDRGGPWLLSAIQQV